MEIEKLGHWSFIAGLILALLAGFVEIPSLPIILFILGLIVGFLNIKERESTPFLIAIIAILLVASSASQLSAVITNIDVIVNNFIAFVSAAALVVAIKQILTFARK